ncbi:MAG TPA: TPM domain-containing protein [Nitrospira sp.]|nr:TPM domain-containing protein [Nitrospira sp.]
MIPRSLRQKSGVPLLCLILVLWVDSAHASLYERPKERIPLPSPIGYVSDHAQVVEREWKDRIRSVCIDLEKKSGVEMVIVTVPSIKPYPSAKHYADALYEKWQIGSTQQEHGVMVLVAVQERQAAMALGRKMFPVITPTVRNEVGRDYLQPAIERGHFGEGLYRTAVALATPAQEVRLNTPSRPRIKGLGIWITFGTTVAVVLFFWWLSRPDLRHPYRRIQKGEYWGTGQGGFGGNWGGFGGGTSGEGYR